MKAKISGCVFLNLFEAEATHYLSQQGEQLHVFDNKHHCTGVTFLGIFNDGQDSHRPRALRGSLLGHCRYSHSCLHQPIACTSHCVINDFELHLSKSKS